MSGAKGRAPAKPTPAKRTPTKRTPAKRAAAPAARVATPRRRRVRQAHRRANRLTGVGVAAMLAILVLMALGPLENYTVASDRVASLEAQRAELAARRDELADRRAALQSDDEMEILARSEYGLVRPGEVPFIVVDPAPSPPSALTPEPTEGPADAPPTADEAWWRRVGRWLAELAD